MLRPIVLHLIKFTAIAFSASIPQQSQIGSGSDTVGSESDGLNLPSNITLPLSNETQATSNKLKVFCDATRFGRNPKVKSCRDLFGYLRFGEEQVAFSQRDSGISHDISLPLRTYSSQCNVVKTGDQENGLV